MRAAQPRSGEQLGSGEIGAGEDRTGKNGGIERGVGELGVAEIGVDERLPIEVDAEGRRVHRPELGEIHWHPDYRSACQVEAGPVQTYQGVVELGVLERREVVWVG